MNFLNFIVTLCAGAFVGWFISRMIEAEQRSIKLRQDLADSNV